MEKSYSDLSNSMEADTIEYPNDQFSEQKQNDKQTIKKTRKKKNYIQPLIANLSDTKYTVVRKVLKNSLGFKITKDSQAKDPDLIWTDNAVQPQQLAKLKNFQKINHFPGMYSLSRKNYLTRNILKMAKNYPQQYDYYPRAWVLPSQLSELRSQMQKQPNSVFIAKPEASSQGKGIFLTKNIDDFDFGQHYVVQKYLKKPLLIDKLKFDLRVYVLVAGCDPLRVYVYKEGLARFATEPYSVPKKENMNNLFMHLTNYAINKQSTKFEFNQSKEEMNKGHKRSLTCAFEHLKAEGYDTEKLWKQTKEIILKTLISVQPILGHHYKSCQSQNYANNMCFEILGLDVIIDSDLKPMILEVNYTPSFSTDTPLDKEIKQNLIKDTITLMNVTQKAKNEAVNSKKKEMMERTLTGKKIWYSKEEREKIIDEAQIKRDKWEQKHLGNFQKVYPLDKTFYQEDHESKLSLFKELLQYSEKAYQENTGASNLNSLFVDIKRNAKVVSNASVNAQRQQEPTLSSETDAERLKQLREAKIAVKTNELEKIYKTKFRPMMANRHNLSQRKGSSIEATKSEKNGSLFSPVKDERCIISDKDTIKEILVEEEQNDHSVSLSKQQDLNYQSSIQKGGKSPIKSTHKRVSQAQSESAHLKPITTNFYERGVELGRKAPSQNVKNSYLSQSNIPKSVLGTHSQQKPYHEMTSKTMNNIGSNNPASSTISGSKNAIYGNKVVFKRPNSAINRKGASTVYNLTFKKEPSLNSHNEGMRTAKQLTMMAHQQRKQKFMQSVKNERKLYH